MKTQLAPSFASAALSAFFVAACASGAAISVNFSPQGPDPAGVATDLAKTTFTASTVVGVIPVSNWNTVLTSGGNVSVAAGTLVDDVGASTSLAFTTSGMEFEGSDIDSPANDAARLLNGHVGVDDAIGRFQITGVPYAVYGLILYISPSLADASLLVRRVEGQWNGPSDFYSLGGVYAGSRTSFLKAKGDENFDATVGANYVRFPLIHSQSFAVEILDGGTGDPLNALYGFQVVESPEPAGGTLSVLGLAGFVARRRASSSMRASHSDGVSREGARHWRVRMI